MRNCNCLLDIPGGSQGLESHSRVDVVCSESPGRRLHAIVYKRFLARSRLQGFIPHEQRAKIPRSWGGGFDCKTFMPRWALYPHERKEGRALKKPCVIAVCGVKKFWKDDAD